VNFSHFLGNRKRQDEFNNKCNVKPFLQTKHSVSATTIYT
jgi:hypothetical protein